MDDSERASVNEDADNEFPPLRRSEAHALWPNLPVADVYEQGSALSIHG